MAIDKLHIRHCLLYEFRQNRNASQATKNICNVYGAQAIDVRTAQRWFSKFRNGNFSLKNERGAGRPLEINIDVLKATFYADPHQTTRDLAEKLGVNQSTVVRQLHRIGMVSSYDWIPHQIDSHQLMETCVSLLTRQNQQSFLDINDEKWVCNNSRAKRHWSPTDKALLSCKIDVQQKKIMELEYKENNIIP